MLKNFRAGIDIKAPSVINGEVRVTRNPFKRYAGTAIYYILVHIMSRIDFLISEGDACDDSVSPCNNSVLRELHGLYYHFEKAYNDMIFVSKKRIRNK